MSQNKFRNDLTTKQRSLDLNLKIDPCFVHHRKIETIIGNGGITLINKLILDIPKSTPDWTKKVHIDHIYSDIFLRFCKDIGIRTLNENIFDQKGKLFCSTHITEPFNNFFKTDRAKIKLQLTENIDKDIFIEFSTNRVSGDTLKSRLHEGGYEISIIGQFSRMNSVEIVYEPIIMGFPWLEDYDQKADFDTKWYHYDYFENFIEDFREFEKVKNFDFDQDFLILKHISEITIKKAFARILKETPFKDWGGEMSDLFSSHLHLNNKRLKAAFLLKGPAKFTPMRLNHLGKNNDQIVRLSKEPADVLIVQHCHEILPAVRETLRAFSVQPGNPRRYCLIDGRDTLRILKGFELLDWALREKKKPVNCR